MAIKEIIFLSIVLLLILFFMYQQLRLVYTRYLKTYKKEIDDYLKSNGLTFINLMEPKEEDWKEAPFEIPTVDNNYKFTSGIKYKTTINDVAVKWNMKDYKLIYAENDLKKVSLIWMEIITEYFKKPKVCFKEGKHVLPKVEKEEKTIKILEYCPACNFKLNIEDKVCPDCELNLK